MLANAGFSCASSLDTCCRTASSVVSVLLCTKSNTFLAFGCTGSLSPLSGAGYVGAGDSGAASGYGLPAGQAQQMQMQYMRDQLRQELRHRSFLSHAQVRLTLSHSISPSALMSVNSAFHCEHCVSLSTVQSHITQRQGL